MARTRPHYGGTLRVEIEGDPWQRPNGVARRLAFDGLTRANGGGVVRPALAVRWTAENDQHRWQFWLRPGVRFNDGTALTAAAVVSSLQANCSANCPWTAVRALGSSVIFTNDVPMPELPALLAGDDFRISISGSNSVAGGLLGTGPFQPTGFANGVLTLTANDSCWAGRPFVDVIEVHVHRSIHDQWLDLSVGRADVVEVPAELMRQAQQQHLTTIASPPVTLLALALKDSGALANPMLRASIAKAVDRSALSNVIFQKQGEITASLLPADTTGYSFLFATERDLKKAGELRGGLALRQLILSFEGGATMQLAAQRIALNLNEAGFTVQTTNANQDADLSLRSIQLPSRDAATALTSVLQRYGQSGALPNSSPASLFNAERDFLDRYTLIPLLYLPRVYAVGARVRDLRLDAAGEPGLADASVEGTP